MWILYAWDGFLAFFQLLVSVSTVHSLKVTQLWTALSRRLYHWYSSPGSFCICWLISTTWAPKITLSRHRDPLSLHFMKANQISLTLIPNAGAPVWPVAVPVCWAKLSSWVSQALHELFSNWPMRWVCLSLVLRRLVAFLREKKNQHFPFVFWSRGTIGSFLLFLLLSEGRAKASE